MRATLTIQLKVHGEDQQELIRNATKVVDNLNKDDCNAQIYGLVQHEFGSLESNVII